MNNRKLLVPLILAAGVLVAGSAFAATLSVQTATNRLNYSPTKVVTVRANAMNGSTRISSSRISSAKVTIKNPSNTTVLNAATMSKDSSTGFVYYNYTLPSNAPKGKWTATVTITDTSSNSGSQANTFKVQLPVPSHVSYVTSYNGPATCITSACHASQANAMFNSVHYQWTGDNQKAIELAAAGSKASKMGGINNFCIQPDMNWLTIFNKTDGTTGPGGCAVCHGGAGLKPSATSSQAQLENIDCLMCHGVGYSRKVVQNADLTYSLVPADGLNVLQIAQTVTRPTREMCMRCHEKSGGGDNYKRGDIESTAKSCTKSYDVHMGSDGQNFSCQECHRTDSHKMAGRGVDMRTLDSTTVLNCENCHSRIPHRSTNVNYSDLNRHSDKVNCSVCHIPTFAKTVATDMHRNWAVMELDTAKKLYDPEMIKQTNVVPQYAWFNGFSHFYKFNDPVSPDANGKQKLAWPDGSFVDPVGKLSKLFPFKIHEGEQPKEATSNVLLPIKNKIAFETGDINGAILAGANAYGIPYTSHVFQATQQYQGIFHGVGPKNTAISCSNIGCHPQITTGANRMPFQSLGYVRRGTEAQLCDVCHSREYNPGFTSLHSKHRDVKNCSACHGVEGAQLKEPKTTLCDNCHSYKSFSTPEYVHQKHVQSKGYDCGNCHTYSADPGTGGHSEHH